MANILGINISDKNKTDINKSLDFFLNDQKGHYLVTPNPEIILKATRDEEYFHILNQADLSIADGFGLVLAGLITNQKIHRLTGSDLTVELLKKSELENIKVLIINRVDGLSGDLEIKTALLKRWPKLQVELVGIAPKEELSLSEREFINNCQAKIMFVALGAPWQEKLIAHELHNLPTIRLALGIGGSFDFLTNKIKRAPLILQKAGLEWFWRVFAQSHNRRRRLFRIYQATCVFPFKVIVQNFFNPFFYRRNVAILLYRKDEILVVKRADENDHWQLPQGGLDGEDLVTAGAREIREELNTNNFVVRAVFKNLYQYKFNKEASSANNRKYIHNYRGQRQSLLIAEFTGQDEDIKINYWDHSNWRWVNKNELVAAVYNKKKEGTAIFLKKFLNLKNDYE